MGTVVDFGVAKSIRELTDTLAKFDKAIEDMVSAWLQLNDQEKANPSIQDEYNSTMRGLITRKQVINNMINHLRSTQQ